MSLEELNNKIKELEKENKLFKKEIKNLEKEINELKIENKKLKEELEDEIEVDNEFYNICNINNGLLEQYIEESDGYDKFMEKYIITKYSKEFLDYLIDNWLYCKIMRKVNYNNIVSYYYDDINIINFLKKMSTRDWKDAQDYALKFLKNNIDNIDEIKDYLNNEYKKFINKNKYENDDKDDEYDMDMGSIID